MKLLLQFKNERGISLVEVLTAIVIFLGGILLVVRMFPGGFAVVKHSEDVTLANRLAQQELERWKGMAANLPGGILPWGWNETSGAYTVLPDISPDNLRDPVEPSDGWPAGFNTYYYTDVNKFRHIYAEATKIPMPLNPAAPDSLGSIYILGFSPIAWDGPGSIKVYSGPMRRRNVWLGIPTLRSLSEYAIDYDNAVIYLRATPYTRRFMITYSYWDNDPLVDGRPDLVPVVSQEIIVNNNTAKQIDPYTVAVDIPGPAGTKLSTEPGYMFIDHGSDSLHRMFELIDAGARWNPNNPYEYKVLDYVAGVIYFNPYGYGYEEYTARGKMPLIAYIDYNVLDWHIIREERKLPDHINSPADCEFKLTLRFIKKAGETIELNGQKYEGLAAHPPYNYLPYDVLALDVETGAYYTEDSKMSDGTPALQVNYKDGIIRFHPLFAGKTFRVYYRADGDWAVQVYKTYDVYRKSDRLSLDYRQYHINNNGIMTFTRCYAGMAVAVDYTFEATIQGQGRLRLTRNGDTFRISEATGPGGYCSVDIRQRLLDLYGPDSDPRILFVSKVYGITLGARVIWRDSGRALKAGKWKSADIQTYLTRAMQ
ncbi:MAG: hypothetical protein K6T99_02080 [Armatimonadetes bacterium]|nr:hypothetical protein [Armatimonadota bacterium]